MIKRNRFDTYCKNERAIFTRWISFTGPLLGLIRPWKFLLTEKGSKGSSDIWHELMYLGSLIESGLKELGSLEVSVLRVSA